LENGAEDRLMDHRGQPAAAPPAEKPCPGPLRPGRTGKSPCPPAAAFLFVLAIVFAFPHNQIRAQAATVPPETPPDSLFRFFSRSLALEHYAGAETAARRAASLDSSAAWAELFTALRIASEQADYGDTLGTARYLTARRVALELFGAALEAREAAAETAPSGPAAAELHLALGMLETAESQRLAEVHHETLGALGPARRGVDHFREALELDSSLTAARAGVLLYDFWKSHALRALSWTPFVADRRGEALEGLRAIVRSGHYARYGAASGLAWALVSSERTREAGILTDSLLASWGEVRGLLEPAGKAYFLAESWDLAADRYWRLVRSIRNAPRRNLVREVGALHRLGHIEAARGRWRVVEGIARTARDLPLSERERERKEDDLHRLQQLKEKARRHLETGAP
jgi:tetratricopeptide (TPR) repeat protein